MYFEFLLRRAHSRRRVERMYWSGVSLNSLTTCSKEVTVGTTGPMGSGLPQFGFPRRFAIEVFVLRKEYFRGSTWVAAGDGQGPEGRTFLILGLFGTKINRQELCEQGSERALLV